jgi:hypothetical protein
MCIWRSIPCISISFACPGNPILLHLITQMVLKRTQLTYTPWRNMGEWRCSSNHSWPRHWTEGEWPASRTIRFTATLDRELGGTQTQAGPSGTQINPLPQERRRNSSVAHKQCILYRNSSFKISITVFLSTCLTILFHYSYWIDYLSCTNFRTSILTSIHGSSVHVVQ